MSLFCLYISTTIFCLIRLKYYYLNQFLPIIPITNMINNQFVNAFKMVDLSNRLNYSRYYTDLTNYSNAMIYLQETLAEGKELEHNLYTNSTAIIPDLYSIYVPQFKPTDQMVLLHIVYLLQNGNIEEFGTYFIGSVQILTSRFYYITYSPAQTFLWSNLPEKFITDEILEM